MSNLEQHPAEVDVPVTAEPAAGVEILTPREVPLGGPRALLVRRTLPQHQRSLIGAWCFVDHYGPQDVRSGTAMDVPPHPHTGLQTVSWLFSGEVEHRDSAGVHAFVRPGELNLMTAGAGICHSEVSTAATTMLHGVQLWVALPDAHRDTERNFDHYVPTPVSRAGATIRVFLGTLDGVSAPVPTFSPLLGAQIDLGAGSRLTLDTDPTFEHGVLVDRGDVDVDGTAVTVAELAYRPAGPSTLELRNTGDRPARVVVLGGTPFTEELVMWWNFVGRSHDDIVNYRDQWQHHDARFGHVDGYRPVAQGDPLRLPAPRLPTTRLRPRKTAPQTPRPQGHHVTTDKTGAETTVTQRARIFTIAVDDGSAGMLSFVDRDGQRIFLHTEVKPAFEGRGLAGILVEAALSATRAEGLRVVAVCPMVAAYVAKHHDFDDILDPITAQIDEWLMAQRHR